MKKKKMYIFALVMVLIISALSGCGAPADENNSSDLINPDSPIILGSFVDTEGGILGNMVLLALEENGYFVTDKVQFGTPDVHRNALYKLN